MEQRHSTVVCGFATLWLAVAAVLGGCDAAPPPSDRAPQVGTTTEALTTSVTYRRGVLGTVADTFISASEMGKSFGAQEKLRVSAKNEALLRFDLSAIPSSAVINSATLSLYLNGGDDEQDDDGADGSREGFPVVPIKIHRATSAWSESTGTYASFNQQFDSTVAGTILATSANVFKSVDMKMLVQQWVNGAPNYGMLIRTTGKRHTIFVSSEGGKVSLRPSLTISYTTPDDHCSSNPCANGGSCQNSANGFTCTCSPGYVGTTCETLVDNCAGSPCLNGGTCTSGINSYSCSCAAGYTGTNCQTNTNECAPNPCQNGGVCTDGVNSHTCACPPGYTGANCETLINNCAGSPCQNGGTCTSGVNSYTCACPAGYTGSNCQSLVDNCTPNPCGNGGTCANGVNSYTCNCAPGYTGANCETLINNCAGSPCQNGGTCTSGVNSYTCACPAGYTGANCEIDINECAPTPCQNGGSCVDDVGSFTCLCAPGYTGATCDTLVDICASAPCLAPSAPVIISADPDVAGTILVKWTAPAQSNNSVLTKYVVQATSSNGGANNSTTTDSATLTTTVNGLTDCRSYAVTVTAFNGVGSTSSAAVSVAPYSAPGTPGFLSTARAVSAISLAWTASSTPGSCGVDHYTVDRWLAGVTTTTEVLGAAAVMGALACPYPSVDCNSPNGYFFRVKATIVNPVNDLLSLDSTYSAYSGSITPYVSYANDKITDIWAAKGCTSCHSPGAGPLVLGGGAGTITSAQTYSNIIGRANVVQPAAVGNSYLLLCPTNVNNGNDAPCQSMNLAVFSSNTIEYRAIQRWITDGAHNANVPFP